MMEQWRNADGLLHRDSDQPAVISCNRREWWVNGVQHRDEDKPAVVAWSDTDPPFEWHEWWVNGNRHREHHRPAFVSTSKLMWWENDMPINYRSAAGFIGLRLQFIETIICHKIIQT